MSRAVVTIAEAAARARVQPKSVSRWVADGKLTAIRAPGGGRTRYVRLADVLAVEAAHHRARLRNQATL